MNQHFFKNIFAAIGDLTVIPEAVDAGGAVSMPAGWGANYSRNLANDALALAIDRATTNWLFNVITAQLQQYQEFGAPEWISTANNGGTAFAYDFGAKVRYSVSGNAPFLTYTSAVAGQATNTSTPGADANWRLTSTGNVDKFNNTYSAAIGGYPLGALLESDDGLSLYVSTTAANTTNFNSTPASIPSLWLPAGGAGLAAILGKLSGGNVWTGGQGSTPKPIAYAGTVTLDLSTANNFVVGTVSGGVITGGITGNLILANPSLTSANYGQSGAIEFIQDATGGRTITSFGSNFLTTGGVLPNLTGTANHRDKLWYYVGYDGKISVSARNNES
jgi:hypothetical protein